MKVLSGRERDEAIERLAAAASIALGSTCFRSKGGSVIVKEGTIIGKGFNSPPDGEVLDHCRKDDLPPDFKSDKTCCVHAEWRAIINALKVSPEKIKGSRLYFVRLDKENRMQPAGRPYCTICSKLALETGIDEIAYFNGETAVVYGAREHNDLSFAFRVQQDGK
ncbi:MAG: hypothetical protein M1160_03455 [Candidatus Marsarchaeota archaeon]|jgi:deoxycytidylate deaminase|nr:hypothetical protein [Candidatus Marsarchaeota archaeon]MCL5111902.1 hypothetical protein [Candidatus Marsarchaeota archaeon]